VKKLFTCYVENMDTRQLRTFLAVTNHHTFAKAAETVFLTPSAVGQQIKALEEEVGAALFDRRTRPPTLTPNGLHLLEMARQTIELEEQTLARMRGETISGTFMLGTVRSSALDLLPQAIISLNKKYPRLTINLHVSLSTSLIADVAAGRLEAAVVAENVPIPQSLRWSPFLKEPLWLIAPANFQINNVRDAIENFPFVRFKSNVPLAQMIDTELARLGVQTKTIAEIDTIASIVTCVSQELGISVVPHVALANEAKLTKIPFGRPQIKRQIGLVERLVSTRSDLIVELHNLLASGSGKYGVKRGINDTATST
jgi:DNA-binding transcriptional LysR family regulator